MEMSEIDESFFNFIEQCAKDNAELINPLRKKWRNSRSDKVAPAEPDGIHELASLFYFRWPVCIDGLFNHKFFHFFN